MAHNVNIQGSDATPTNQGQHGMTFTVNLIKKLRIKEAKGTSAGSIHYIQLQHVLHMNLFYTK